MKRILVTGSRGFIGNALCQHIKERHQALEIVTLDRFGTGEKHYSVDITSSSLQSIVLEIQPDIIVHLAGNVSVKYSQENPLVDFQINSMGTLALLTSALKTRCDNFIYVTSGGSIYTSAGKRPANEQSPTSPTTPYGLSKMIGEQYLSMLAEKQMNWSSLALSNCYGPVRQQQNGVIYEIWRNLTNGVRPSLFGSNVVRDFIHIQDVVNAISAVIERPVNCRVNISTGVGTSLIELLTKIQGILGTDLEPHIFERSSAEVEFSILDNSLAKHILGWYPRIEIDKGLKMSFPDVQRSYKN